MLLYGDFSNLFFEKISIIFVKNNELKHLI